LRLLIGLMLKIEGKCGTSSPPVKNRPPPYMNLLAKEVLRYPTAHDLMQSSTTRSPITRSLLVYRHFHCHFFW